MRRLIRRLFGIRRAITKSEAIEAAKRYAESQGWPWREPVAVWERVFRFAVTSNATYKGGNVRVEVRVADGSIAWGVFSAY